ncbi:hypothetical protein ACSHWO_36075 (plasmid) [Streptomyces sp. HUAS TT3]|uniref:hypothetical protein n=1 Tax=Streptomyces sp. HUAS TT3 TaxID=3447510 RepID=UPI003F655268
MGSARPSFIELAGALGGALDEWSAAVRQALAGQNRYQNWLARRLGTPPPRVSSWLRGREQVWLSGTALPGVGTTQSIVRELGLDGESARRLVRLADRIDHLQAQLEELRPRDWRKRVEEQLRGDLLPAAAAPEPAPTAGAAERSGAQASVPVAVDPVPGRWASRPRTTRLVAAATAAVAAAGIVAYLGSERPDDDPGTAGATSTPAAVRTRAQRGTDDTGTSGSTGPGGSAPALEQPGLEKNTLGPDSRCGEPLPGPEAVVWRVCARVEAGRVSFAVKLTNQADGATTARVRVRVQYVQAKVFHPCPMAPNAQPVDVPAGKTVITDPGLCSVPREAVPFAYQGVGWVVPADATGGSYELSPTAHVYPDRTLWKPDLL